MRRGEYVLRGWGTNTCGTQNLVPSFQAFRILFLERPWYEMASPCESLLGVSREHSRFVVTCHKLLIHGAILSAVSQSIGRQCLVRVISEGDRFPLWKAQQYHSADCNRG